MMFACVSVFLWGGEGERERRVSVFVRGGEGEREGGGVVVWCAMLCMWTLCLWCDVCVCV